MLVGIVGRLFVDIDTHLQVDEDGTLTGINAALQDTDRRTSTNIEAILVGQPRL